MTIQNNPSGLYFYKQFKKLNKDTFKLKTHTKKDSKSFNVYLYIPNWIDPNRLQMYNPNRSYKKSFVIKLIMIILKIGIKLTKKR
jgi:hypothetical protein